jgi:hypothetical protein
MQTYNNLEKSIILIKGLYLYLWFYFPNYIFTLEILYKPIPSPRLFSTEISMLDYYKEFLSNKVLYSRL